MKRSYLWTGVAYFVAGLLLAVASAAASGKLQSLLAGFAGGGIFGGLATMGRYYYWTRPGRVKRYQEKQEEEEICLKDERNEMLRDKAGRYAYILSLLVLAVSTVLFSVLHALEIGHFYELIMYQSALLVFLYVAGIWIYWWLKARN